jgi:hypothetical protein
MMMDITRNTPEHRAAYYKAKAIAEAVKERINDSN